LEKSGLRIVPYEVSLQYKTTPLPDTDIAKKHHVNNILKGSISQRGGMVVFEVELRRVKPDGVLMSSSFPSRSETDYSGALSDIATAVAEKLGAKLAPPRTAPAPKNPEAYQYYSYGLMIYRDRYLKTQKPGDFEVVLGNFRRALELEPASAVVCWQLGMLYEGRFNDPPNRQEGDEKLMMQYLRRAYELDPALPESNLAMGWYHFNREDHDRAHTFFKRALELDGDNAEAHLHVGSFLRSLGLYEQARRHYRRALGVAPAPDDFVVWHRLLADCHAQLGEYAEGAKFLQTAVGVNPSCDLIQDYAVFMIAMREYAEAERQIKVAHDLGAEADRIRRLRALFAAATGRREAALELMKAETNPNDHLAICTNALLGRRDMAIQGIEATRGPDGFRKYRWYRYTYLVLLNNMFFDNLRDEPAFQAIIEKEKAAYQERVKKYGDL